MVVCSYKGRFAFAILHTRNIIKGSVMITRKTVSPNSKRNVCELAIKYARVSISNKRLHTSINRTALSRLLNDILNLRN